MRSALFLWRYSDLVDQRVHSYPQAFPMWEYLWITSRLVPLGSLDEVEIRLGAAHDVAAKNPPTMDGEDVNF